MQAALRGEEPSDPEMWDRFAMDNRASHDVIRQALIAAGKPIDDYVLYPIDESDWMGWLQRHAFTHQTMNSLTNNISQDLSLLDPKDKQAVYDWMQEHWLEHQAVEASLGVAS